MNISTSQKIRLLCAHQNVSLGELSRRLGQTQGNLSQKLARSNFTEGDLRAIAKALGCEYVSGFRLPDGEEI